MTRLEKELADARDEIKTLQSDFVVAAQQNADHLVDAMYQARLASRRAFTCRETRWQMLDLLRSGNGSDKVSREQPLSAQRHTADELEM